MTKPVKVYSTRVCPYCDAAKSLFDQLQVPYENIFLESDPDLFDKLSQENNNWRTVPMIFIGDKFVGGFDDLKKLHTEGTLMGLVNG